MEKCCDSPQFLLAHVFGSFFAPLSSEGFLHWGSDRYCLTLNVETEIITRSELPIPPDHDQYQYRYTYYYLSTGRYLTLLIGRNDFSWEVWEMKPAESGEWRKAGLPKIQLEARKFRLNPIGWVKYPEVLAFSCPDQTQWIFYNLETHEINTTELDYYCKFLMDGQTVPPSAFRRPPPPSRCSDSNMLSKTTMLSGGRCRSSYLKSTIRFLRRQKARKSNIQSLSEELLTDILACFPADFLHDTAMRVCRRWSHIIQSRAFITEQIPHSTYGLVLSSPSESDSYPYSVYVTATQEGRIRTSELSSIRENKILASGDGLAVELRCVDVNGESLSLHVINPTTKQSFLLPSVSTHNRDVYHEQCGIAYSAASMKYKVTLPYKVNGKLACLDIVTVGVDKSWRRVEIPPLLERFRSLLYSFPLSSEGGFLHWGKGVYCLTLNVETENFTVSEAPIPRDQRYDNYSCYYLSTGRYLTLLVRRGELLWEVWEMKPSESGEWRKAVMPDIDLEAKKCWLRQEVADRDDDDDRPLEMFPVGWVKYPEVLAFSFWGACILYNLETCEINTIELPDDYLWEEEDYRGIVHRNSLAWL